MPVKALLYAVALQKPQDLRTLISLIQRRIVEEAQLLPLPCRLQGRLQPSGLPGQHLAVVGTLTVQLVKPAPTSGRWRECMAVPRFRWWRETGWISSLKKFANKRKNSGNSHSFLLSYYIALVLL